MSNDTLRMDVAGSLFTNMYRNVKIKGHAPAAQHLEGTGSVSSCGRIHIDMPMPGVGCENLLL